MKKRILAFAICIAMVFSLAGCGKQIAWVAEKYDSKAQKEQLNKTVIAENETLSLEWVRKNYSVALIDKQSGKRWEISSSKEGEPTVDEYGIPIKKHPELETAIAIEYVNDTSYTLENAYSYIDAVTNGKAKAEVIENGVRVEYYFKTAEIMVPVEYVLRDDSLAITVDPNKIQENDKKIASISITPYWCSTENNATDSYLFVPSGSGALVNTDERSQSGVIYSAPVYGRDQVMTMDDYVSTEKQVRLPVYGAKQGDKGTCAIIETASDSANISVKAGSATVGYSSVCANFQVRGYNENFGNSSMKNQDVYATSMVKTPMTVGFYPLLGEKASYSGMAEIYRNYLQDNGYLKEKVSDVPLSVTIVGGQMVSRSFLGLPYETLLPATTIKQAQEILKEIKENTNVDISAKLIGFGDTGLDLASYAGGFKLNSNLGSKKDLASLNTYCKENDIDLYIDFDLIRFKNSSSGFSNMFDVAQNTCLKVTELYEYNVATRSRMTDTKYYLLSRRYLVDGGEKLLKKIKNWSISGISFETLSQISYSDYSDQKSAKYYSKGNMSKDVIKIMSSAKEKYKIASTDANVYAALSSDIIYNAPSVSSGENVFSADVPFYQMVFKGYIPMTTESVNLASNEQTQILHSVEAGSGINYVVTSEYDNEFSDSSNYYFFGSKFSDLSDSLYSDINELSNYFDAIKNQGIKSHTILENGLRLTEFSNGIKVYVNYSENNLSSPLGEVSPNGFIWG